jgi:hypothetical protein
MEDTVIEKLCARLTGTVANKPADEFYNEFNLNKGTVFSEFYFKEMMQIFHFPGMELWPKLTTSEDLGTKKQGKPPPQIYLSLVCFRPPGFASSKSGPIKRRVKLAMKRHVTCSALVLIPLRIINALRWQWPTALPLPFLCVKWMAKI